VVESYSRVEQQLRALIDAAGIPVRRPLSGRALARLAEEHDLIYKDTREAIEGLSLLRDLAAHGQAPANLDEQRALDYAALSDAVLRALGTSPGAARLRPSPPARKTAAESAKSRAVAGSDDP
jgi:hypothetical protein